MYAICSTQVSSGCIIEPNLESIIIDCKWLFTDYFANNDRLYNRLWEGTKSIIIFPSLTATHKTFDTNFLYPELLKSNSQVKNI